MHVFLDAGKGNVLAFFELPTQPPMDRDRNTPPGCSTWRWKWQHGGTAGRQSALVAGGIECSVPSTTPSSSRSISSTRTATAWSWPANVGTPEMMAKLDAVKWEMLEEWSQTRRAPKHAAWMHAPADA
jgi:hypothetical protein